MELFKFLQLINKENNIGKVREIFSFISCLALFHQHCLASAYVNIFHLELISKTEGGQKPATDRLGLSALETFDWIWWPL